jgi:hypothetical protein
MNMKQSCTIVCVYLSSTPSTTLLCPSLRSRRLVLVTIVLVNPYQNMDPFTNFEGASQVSRYLPPSSLAAH